MATEIYSDSLGNRIVNRHAGPPGPGLTKGGTTGQIYVKASNADFDGAWANPPSGTGAAVGPASSLNGSFVLFDGTTGKLLKDSTLLVADLAPRSLVDNKEDKVAGKGLSTNDFTTLLLNKLTALGTDNFRGAFASLPLLVANPVVPVAGDYAVVESIGIVARLYFWDDANSSWTPADGGAFPTGAELAAMLYNTVGAALWDKVTADVFTTADRDTLAAAASQDFVTTSLTNAGIGVSAYGTVGYFDVAGTSVTFSGVSDGTSNMVKITTATTVSATTSGFNDGSATARLGYTATRTQTFKVDAEISFNGTTTGVTVFGLAKNGAVISTSKVLCSRNSSADVVQVSLTELVSLVTGDYVEVFVGNVTDTAAVLVKSFSINLVLV